MKKILCIYAVLVLSTHAVHGMFPRRSGLLTTASSHAVSTFLEHQKTTENLYRLQAKFPTHVIERYKQDFIYDRQGKQPHLALHDTEKQHHELALHTRDEWIRHAYLSCICKIQFDMFSHPVHNFWRNFLHHATEYREYLRHLPENHGPDIHPLLNIRASTCIKEWESDLPCKWKQKEQFRNAYRKQYCYGDNQEISPLWELNPCYRPYPTPSQPRCIAENNN